MHRASFTLQSSSQSPEIAPPKPLSGSLRQVPPILHLHFLSSSLTAYGPALQRLVACPHPYPCIQNIGGGLHHGRGGTPSLVNTQWDEGDGAAPGPAISAGWLVGRWTGPVGLLGAVGSGHCTLSSHLPLVPHQPGARVTQHWRQASCCECRHFRRPAAGREPSAS